LDAYIHAHFESLFSKIFSIFLTKIRLWTQIYVAVEPVPALLMPKGAAGVGSSGTVRKCVLTVHLRRFLPTRKRRILIGRLISLAIPTPIPIYEKK
jgi:hypothetical protein